MIRRRIRRLLAFPQPRVSTAPHVSGKRKQNNASSDRKHHFKSRYLGEDLEVIGQVAARELGYEVGMAGATPAQRRMVVSIVPLESSVIAYDMLEVTARLA